MITLNYLIKIHYFDSNLFKTVGTPWNAMLMVLPQMMFSSLIHCQATILLFCFLLKIFVSPWILVWGLHQFWQYFKEPFTYASDCHLVAQTLYQWGACPTLFHHFLVPSPRFWHWHAAYGTYDVGKSFSQESKSWVYVLCLNTKKFNHSWFQTWVKPVKAIDMM